MQEDRWYQFQEAAHKSTGSPAAQRAWARGLGEAELAFYAASAPGWVTVHTQRSAFSPSAERHHSAVTDLAQACVTVYGESHPAAGGEDRRPPRPSDVGMDPDNRLSAKPRDIAEDVSKKKPTPGRRGLVSSRHR